MKGCKFSSYSSKKKQLNTGKSRCTPGKELNLTSVLNTDISVEPELGLSFFTSVSALLDSLLLVLQQWVSNCTVVPLKARIKNFWRHVYSVTPSYLLSNDFFVVSHDVVMLFQCLLDLLLLFIFLTGLVNSFTYDTCQKKFLSTKAQFTYLFLSSKQSHSLTQFN